MKLLKIVFIILILVTIGEVGYYFYIVKFKSSTDQIGSSSQVQSNQLDDSAAQPSLHPRATIKVEQKEFNERTEMIQENVLTSSVISDRFESEILALDTDGGVKDNFVYKVKLTLKVGEMGVDFLLNDSGFERVKVHQLSGNKEIPITFADLKPGDKIIIDRKLDTFKDIGNNVTEFKITKI